MTYQPTYNSRDERYKSPYGAVSSGTAVRFSLRPPRAEGFSHAAMTARFESWDNKTVTLPMPWQGFELSQDIFTAQLDTQGYVGLVWYSFKLERLDGRKQELGPYQLTVYDGSQSVPAWFGEGVTYQIFPDRFRRSRIPDPAGLVGGRTVHQNWEDSPEYRPDHKGEVRNRDFFGGDFKGVMEKLDYLKSLGVETLYFNPIFEAAENHRYGTADYSRVDPMLGTNEDFSRLCEEAHKRGMRVMLDGVFNHTGFVSRYFNGDGFYPDVGASQSWDSPYRPWFNFIQWPKKYESWWGIYSLPAVNESNPDYRNFIFAGQDSVVRRWLRAGADGWRLDVADELPDDFVHGIHQAAREEKPDAVVIGEVWEDGSTKIAYGVRRKHILGGHCDGLMNYPLRSAILAFFTGGGGEHFVESMETIRENYPAFAFYSAMNSLDGGPTSVSPPSSAAGARICCGRPACCCSASPAPPPFTTGMRRAWRALKIPSTARPTPGAMRTGSCWTGTGPWARCGKSTRPCAGALSATSTARAPCWPLCAGRGSSACCAPSTPVKTPRPCSWRGRESLRPFWAGPASRWRRADFL